MLDRDVHHARSAALRHEHEPGPVAGPGCGRRHVAGLWIYFVAPPLGMLAAAETFRARARTSCRPLREAPPRSQARASSTAVTERQSMPRRDDTLRRHHHRHRRRRRHARPSARAAGQAHPDPRARRLRAARERRTGTRARSTSRRSYHTKEVWHDKDGKPLHPHTNYYVGGNTKFYGAALFRLREQDFGELAPSRRHLAGVADQLRRPRAVLHAGRAPLPRARPARRGPDRAAGERRLSVSCGQPRAAHPAAQRRLHALRDRSRSMCRSASGSTRRTRRTAAASAATPATASRAWCTPRPTRR